MKPAEAKSKGTGTELLVRCEVMVSGRYDAGLSSRFCQQLVKDLDRFGSTKARAGEFGEDGQRAVLVQIEQKGPAIADVRLAKGVTRAGKLVVEQHKTMSIDVSDGNFGPGSAGVLVLPIVALTK